MTKSTHGGSRPATRPDDGRHNNTHGSPGRLPRKFTLKVGDRLIVTRTDRTANEGNDAELALSETWTVNEIARTHVQLAGDTGDTVRIVR